MRNLTKTLGCSVYSVAEYEEKEQHQNWLQKTEAQGVQLAGARGNNLRRHEKDPAGKSGRVRGKEGGGKRGGERP